MGNRNDPIECFNLQECVYVKCPAYNDTLSVCELEWLKRLKQVGDNTNPLRSQPAPQARQDNRQKIADANKKEITPANTIQRGMKNIKVHGKVLDDPNTREVKTVKGPKTITSFRIDDGTGEVRLTFWTPGKVPPTLKAGVEVTIDGLLGGDFYDGLPQANGYDYVKFTIGKA